MSEESIPPRWTSAPIGDLCVLVNGRAFKPSDWTDDGLPIVRIQNLNNPDKPFNRYDGEVLEKFLIDSGELLFAWSGTPGTSFGAHVWRGGKAVLNQHIFRVLFDELSLNKELFRLAINERLNHLISRAHGGVGLRHVTKPVFEATEVSLPPLPEQHRIVEAIESYLTRLDDAVASLERVQKNLKRYRASVLKAAVEGRLVPTEAELARQEGREFEPANVLLKRILKERRQRWEEAELAKMKAKGKEPKNDKWKEKYKEPVAPDTSELPELPEGWVWTCVDALADPIRSVTYGVVKLGDEHDGGVPTLRSSNVRHLSLDLGYVKPISPEIAKSYRRTELVGGEVLVTVRGTLGGIAVAPPCCAGFNISREVAMIALVDTKLGPGLANLIASSALQSWMMRHAKGITYRGVNIETLKQLPIPLPPLKEQQQMARTIDRHLSFEVSCMKSCEATQLRLQRLRQSILKWAFEGKLVDQDPADEPASVLLERIKAERAALEAQKKANKKKTSRRKK